MSEVKPAEPAVGSDAWAQLMEERFNLLKNTLANFGRRVIVLEAALGLLAARLVEGNPNANEIIATYIQTVHGSIGSLPLQGNDAERAKFEMADHVETLRQIILGSVGVRPSDLPQKN